MVGEEFCDPLKPGRLSYLPYGSQVITHTSTGSTLQLEDIVLVL